ncbi:MAG: RsmE family RNA methyltransferase [Bacilli bacterium]|nr:RsmE family RNA methyltransferase [Bacilli bacterium]
MQRYFALNDKLELNTSDIYHMHKVMRMKKGDKVEVIYDGNIHLCKIKELSVNNVKLDIEQTESVDNQLPVKVSIAISLVNEQKWNYILQKTTELGVSEIIPLQLSRTLIKIDEDRYMKKMDRWLKICKEAAEQSHRIDIPSISKMMTIKDLIETNYDLKIVCSTSNESINLKQILSKDEKCGRILVVIGPEGGISPAEETMLVKNDFIKASLGNFILRVETAPLFVLSAINYELMR